MSNKTAVPRSEAVQWMERWRALIRGTVQHVNNIRDYNTTHCAVCGRDIAANGNDAVLFRLLIHNRYLFMCPTCATEEILRLIDGFTAKLLVIDEARYQDRRREMCMYVHHLRELFK